MSGEPAPAASAQARHRSTIEADRRRIANGEHPAYHVLRAISIDGSVDVRIRELPLIHLFVPDDAGVSDGARFLIARTLDVDPRSFDLLDDASVD